MSEFKVGDIVVVVEIDNEAIGTMSRGLGDDKNLYYRKGDIATLVEVDGGGWGADFTLNKEYYKDGIWYINESCIELQT